MLNMLNLLNAMRIFRIVHWIMLIIERTFRIIGIFMMFLIPLQFGFAFFSYAQIGPFIKQYFTIMDSIKM